MAQWKGRCTQLRLRKKTGADVMRTPAPFSRTNRVADLEGKSQDELQRARRRDAVDRPEAIPLGQIPVRVVGQVRNRRVRQVVEVRRRIHTSELRVVQRVEYVG